MRAKKIFHVFVGFWFANILFLFVYLGGSALYLLITGMSDPGDGSLISAFPRFSMIASAPLRLAAGAVVWPSRRYVSMGMLAFGAVAFLYWLTIGWPA